MRKMKKQKKEVINGKEKGRRIKGGREIENHFGEDLGLVV